MCRSIVRVSHLLIIALVVVAILCRFSLCGILTEYSRPEAAYNKLFCSEFDVDRSRPISSKVSLYYIPDRVESNYSSSAVIVTEKLFTSLCICQAV